MLNSKSLLLLFALASPAAAQLAQTGAGNAGGSGGGGGASVSFQAFGSESSGTSTATFNGLAFGPAAGNRVIAVGAAYRITTGNSNPITSMTIGGVAATQVPGAVGTNAATALDTDIWYASVPTGTAGNVVVNYTAANARSGVYVYSVNTNTPAPTGGAGNGATTATTLSASITVPSNGIGLAFAAQRQGVGGGNTDSFTAGATLDADNALPGPNHGFWCGRVTSIGSISVTASSVATANDFALSLAAWGP